jgi:hypothetical protein
MKIPLTRQVLTGKSPSFPLAKGGEVMLEVRTNTWVDLLFLKHVN